MGDAARVSMAGCSASETPDQISPQTFSGIRGHIPYSHFFSHFYAKFFGTGFLGGALAWQKLIKKGEHINRKKTNLSSGIS